MIASIFREHIAALVTKYETGLERIRATGVQFDAVLIHSGSEQYYFGDDRGIPFQAYGHFNHWLPLNRPDQFILFTPGHKPVYLQVVPDDFWYEQSATTEDWWAAQFEIIRLTSVSDVGKHLGSTRIAYLGGNPSLAAELGIETALINPTVLLAYLDFQRAIKSSYELEQLRAANRIALKGHAAARQHFLDGANEFEIHKAFLNACEILETESPYTNIVALDEKSAILHYQHKRRSSGKQSQVLLIDAGCRVNAYCSDVTRTSTKQSAHPVFKSLLAGMDQLQQNLVGRIRPGMAYQELHGAALRGVTTLLQEHDICSGTTDELVEQRIPQLFMPHGVGHLLGVQVHDVGGHQGDDSGESIPPPADSPMLRNTRTMREDMVFTVEPGVYFIPLLLNPQRNTALGKPINWSLVDSLIPLGGIRIEDNVRVRPGGVENLTRPAS